MNEQMNEQLNWRENPFVRPKKKVYRRVEIQIGDNRKNEIKLNQTKQERVFA